VGGEAPVTPVSTLDSSYFNLSYKPCDNTHLEVCLGPMVLQNMQYYLEGERTGFHIPNWKAGKSLDG
jgi:hypothetical protein